MTPSRYIALIRPSPQAGSEIAAIFAAHVARTADLDHVHVTANVSVASTGAPVAVGSAGLVVGDLFRTGDVGRVTHIDMNTCERIVDSKGGHLIEHYWGPYVALIAPAGASQVDVIRAPLGTLPCYIVHRSDAIVLASDIELLVAFGLFTPLIAWNAVLHQLATRDLREPQTCLRGLVELPGGQRLRIRDGETEHDELWSPWTFVDSTRRIERDEDAIEAVATATLDAIANRAGRYRKVALMLSGGLDSSIVAAALKASDVEIAALTLVTNDAIGDERRHARRVARALGMPLTESNRDVAQIDIGRSAARRLPRPSVRVFLQESARRSAELAADTGAEAIFNGGGGDNVFCSLQSSSPVVDRLRVERSIGGVLETGRDISIIAQASMPSVLFDAAKRAWFGKPPLRPFRDITLLTSDAAAGVAPTDGHPWLHVPRDALPGSAAHIRLIAFAQSYVEGLDPQDAVPTIAPLLSQPLVETCLAIPSWMWCQGGQNRSIARAAFAPLLPADTVHRRSKGTPDSFVAEIFEVHRAAIRELLAEGLLVNHRLIDRKALLDILADHAPVQGNDFRRILQFVDIEAWARAIP